MKGKIINETISKAFAEIENAATETMNGVKTTQVRTPVNDEYTNNTSASILDGIRTLEEELKSNTDSTNLDSTKESSEIGVETEALSQSTDVESQENGEKISTTLDTEQLAVTKSPSEIFNEARENAIEKLKAAGIYVSNVTHGAVKIATALDCDKELWLKAIKPRKSQLVYKLYEIDEDGISDEMENDKTILAPYELERATTKVVEIIMNMQGYYGEDITNITTHISIIAKYRLLQPVVADSDVLSGPQIVKLLEKWFEDHVVDPRVAAFEMGGHVHVALVRRGEKTPYRIFNEIISEIAPANKPLAVKDWLYENDMLVHDDNDVCKDTQKTLSISIMREIGATGDKSISFNFGEKFNKEFYEWYQIEHDTWSINKDLYLVESKEVS